MKSFTLIEIIISLSIIAVLSSILLSLPQRASQFYSLLNAAQQLGSEIQHVEGLALATSDFKGASSPGGWGIYIDPNASQRCYIIFQDVNQDKQYNGPTGANLCDQTKKSAELAQRIYLPSNVTFDPTTLPPDFPAGPVTLVFVPPHPDVFINGASLNWIEDPSTQSKMLKIGLKIPSGDQKIVTVNALGTVQVQ